MPTVMVTGASRGLGAAFVAAYASRAHTRVIAVDRLPSSQTASNVQSYEVDISCQNSIDDFVRQHLRDQEIDLVIHSAGIRGLVSAVETRHPDDVAACETMGVMDFATLMQTFQTNAVGTFLFFRAILPNLRKSTAPKVIVMSSRMGSIGNNQRPNKDAGSAYAYRASKAALNNIVRSFAADVPDVTFVLNHPGRVETQLVKCKEEGAISPEESLSTVLPLIDQWTVNNSGKFYDRFGAEIPW